MRTGEALREQAISCTSASSVDVVILGLKEEVDKMLQPKGKPSQKKYPFF